MNIWYVLAMPIAVVGALSAYYVVASLWCWRRS